MLYICPTPIGNIEDITIRTLKVFEKVDYILCEDTRRTIKLLNHYEIKKKLISLNEHTEYIKKEMIINDLQGGKEIALVSDAGMPGIQDPGQIIIKEAIKNNIIYTVLPGPSAFITALIGSGIAKDEFVFLGFLPRKGSERRRILKRYSNLNCEIILYEAPHRFKKLLEDIKEELGNRNVVIARELTKKYEEYIFSNVEDAIEKIDIKGEIVLIIQSEDKSINEENKIDINYEIKKLLDEGKSTKEISKLLSKKFNYSKNEIYNLALDTQKCNKSISTKL